VEARIEQPVIFLNSCVTADTEKNSSRFDPCQPESETISSKNQLTRIVTAMFTLSQSWQRPV
jgi:hypothetical protein